MGLEWPRVSFAGAYLAPQNPAGCATQGRAGLSDAGRHQPALLGCFCGAPVFSSWRSCWSSVPSQDHISKEEWKHDPGSSVCWTCSGRQSPQGGERTRNVCRTRDVFFPSVPGEDLLT